MIETKTVTLPDGTAYRFGSLTFRQYRNLLLDHNADPLVFPFQIIAAAMNNVCPDEPYSVERLRSELSIQTFFEPGSSASAYKN